jgi:putative ABC transport system substrate-binding protein
MNPISSFALAVSLSVVTVPCAVAAQGHYRIPILVAENQSLPTVEGFKQRMTELGYVEGKNVAYDFQFAKDSQDTLQKLAESLVRQKPHLIVTSSTTATIPIAKLTQGTGLPVVFLSAGNPLRFVKSYASSGNNITGVSSSVLDLAGKQIELMKEIVPRLKKFVLLANPIGTLHEQHLKRARQAAGKLNLDLTEVEIRAQNAQEVVRQLSRINHKLGDAMLIAPDAAFSIAIEDISQQGIKERLPCFGQYVGPIHRGSVAAYAADSKSLGRQAALLVDKVLKGAKPSDLPIEQADKLNLVINLKLAKAFGLAIPKDLLIQADALIK